MSIYFDFETINELTGESYNYYRQQKEFTLNELSEYNGRNGNPAYVAIEGIVYDVSNEPVWNERKNKGITAGEDLTEQFNYYHGMDEILNNAPKIGVLTDDNYMNSRFNEYGNRQIKQNTSKFKPDDWIRYIDPLVSYAMRESNQQGSASRRAYQKYMLLGVLVGLGKTPQDAIRQVQEWQTTGASQILKGTGTTGTGATGGVGTGTTGTGSTMGTGTGSTMGTGTTGTGATTGTGTGTTGGTTGGTSSGFGGFGGNIGPGMGNIFGGFTPGTGTGVPYGGFGSSNTGTSAGTGTNTGVLGGASGGAGGGFGGIGGNAGSTSGGTGREVETTEDTDRRDRLYFD